MILIFILIFILIVILILILLLLVGKSVTDRAVSSDINFIYDDKLIN